ncbi:LIM and calponin homology domains-containing protein 1 isoform X2 [Paramisgurnus dabryanus]|uniref:LIM and calponin homology domains-containing protein 1 isoform X2 n=1 Tax=Paramisgurnus dabryanus TaxID=90735 RepID=UPI0031F45224
MASPGSDAGRHLALQPHPHHLTEPAPEPAVREAQRWIEAVTGRSFGDKDFRGGLDNGILLCELLSSIKPGLVKKINRLPTPVAALDNVALFLKGCEELGLKGFQLFDPGDLQDPSNKGQDGNRKLKNVLITIFWLGRAANSSATYNGPTLDLHEFEGLLSQMRKEAEDRDSPKRSIRDSGYIDCWESERSDSLSPPKHTRDDSFDSLDSIGSRSRQTPSPDGLLTRGYSDDRGSDSDCDTPHRKMPDIRKDDMLVRRTSCSEPRTPVPFNQYLPNRSNQSSYMPAPVRRPRADREESRKSWSNATSPVGGERPFSEVELSSVVAGTDVYYVDPDTVETYLVNQHFRLSASNDLPPKDLDFNNPQLSEPQMRSPCPPNHHFSPSVQTQPIEQNHSDSQKMDEEETEGDGWDFLHSDLQMLHNQTAGNDARFRHTSSVFDDTESVSMIDMRSEEDSLSPHSQVRHELMHNQYNKLKEDEDYWQDDLARWKSRRRSVSQDLIKKEEERKMMERMMSGDECSQRRKSIKTYREIVEEKERREQELHEAYRNARTPEEASAVLQKYAQRFTISEAILERLKLPKLLERSVSADPTRHSSPPVSLDISTSNPMQYLRQQSLPTPKFTSTVEARVTGFTVEQGIKGDAENILGPARSLASKPYRQSGRAGLRTAKVDEVVNGERDDDVHSIEEEDREGSDRHREEDSLQFFPSPSQPTEIRQTDVSEVSSTDTHKMTEIKQEMMPQAGATSTSPKVSEPKTEENVADKGKSTEDHTSMSTDASDVNQCESNVIQTDASAAQVQKLAMESPPKPANRSDLSIPESNGTASVCQTPNTEMAEQSDGNVPPMVLNLMKRVEHISWSPEEERKRQKKWQEEQERMLQEKYRREQLKLKHEWELAQKEVEEEERRYHEEERKILEETVTPLTPHGPITPSAVPITHSTLHNNSSADSVQRQTTVQMTVSSSSQHCGTGSYGQKGPEGQSQEKQVTPQSSQDVSLSNKQQPQQAETLKKTTSQTKPGERKRSVSGKKLCSSCGHPLGKGAAMIIETLSLYFHIQCFKCGICKGQLGDTSTGTDVRIRNGLLNCHQCYIHSRSAGQPTTL